MPRKNIWLDKQGLADLAAIKEKWGCSEGEVVRRALHLAAVLAAKGKK
jgi:hypothetical protein